MERNRVLSQIGVFFVTSLIVLLSSQIAYTADFYVSTTGTNSTTCLVNDPCSLATIPWATVDNETSTIYLMGGTYDQLDVQHMTTANTLYIRPCSYSASCPEGSDGMVIFDRSAPADPAVPSTTIRLSSANNVTVDGSKETDDHTYNIRVKPNNNSGVYIATGKQNIVVKYIEITGMLDEKEGVDCYNGGSDCQVYGISAGLVGAGCEIAYNYIHDNWGMADIFISTSTASYGVASVHDNNITGGTINYTSGSGKGVDFYNNTFAITAATGAPYDIMHFYNGGADLQYFRVFNNTFSNELTGNDAQFIFIESYGTAVGTHNVRIYNNTFTSASNSPFNDEMIKLENKGSTSSTVNDVIIANNTFKATGDRAFFVLLSATIPTTYGAITPVLIVNNIFYNGKGIVYDKDVSWSSEADVILNNNLFYHSSSLTFDWLDSALTTKTTYTSTTTFNTDHSTTNATGDPLFVSASDLSLQSGSPAKDVGADLSAYFTTDYMGNTRSGTWDIGAYEYGAGNQSTLLVTSPNGKVTSNPAGINCGSTCSADYDAETAVTLTASANSGYTFTGWSGGGCSGTGTCTVIMNEATSVKATFSITQYNLTVTKPGTGVGTVTGSDGLINCGSTCSVNYESGKAVTLAASATSGSTFTGWSGGGCSGKGTCTATMTAAKSVAATFTPVYNLTVTKSVTGAGTITSSDSTINCGSTCSVNYNPGTSVSLTASTNSGYTFTGWAGGGCSGTGTCTVSMVAATSVTATFATSVYNLTVTKPGTGVGTVTGSDGLINCGSTCSVNYESGKAVTLAASATSGSTFSGWSGGCSGTGACSVTMTAAKSVAATFATSVVYKLTVTKSGTGSGTVTSSPVGISCGSTCSANYTSWTVVTLAASANSGSTFSGWSGGCTGTGTCTVNMIAAKSVTATFARSVKSSKGRR